MRGKEFRPSEDVFTTRITPAYAGKSEKARNCVIFTGDHPRLCGEKLTKWEAQQKRTGSPPPMRGKVQSITQPSKLFRITPAYAGKRHDISTIFAACRDHPRLCGEKGKISGSLSTPAGSPPPMRGKALDKDLSIPKDRITPAYAGKRFLSGMLRRLIRDHPRLCGEKHMEKGMTNQE